MAETGNELNQYLSFLAAGEEYAISIVRVKEIIEFSTVTHVPAAAAAIRGVVNLRGCVVPLVDLAVRFGLPPTEVTKRSCVVIVELAMEGESVVVGILCDAVSQVVDLPAGRIQPPPTFGTRAHAKFLSGMAEVGKKFVLILDLDRTLENVDLIELAEAAPTEGEGSAAGMQAAAAGAAA